MPFYAYKNESGDVLMSGFTDTPVSEIPLLEGMVAVETETMLPMTPFFSPVTWGEIKAKRNTLLGKTDYLFRPDIYPNFTEEQKQSLLIYCQALRDITTQPDPASIMWPTKPEFVK